MGEGRDFDIGRYFYEFHNEPIKRSGYQRGSGDYMWRTKTGIISMRDMSDEHLRNAIAICESTGNNGKGDQLQEILDGRNIMSMKYDVGDIVRKRYGKKPMRIERVSQYSKRYTARYIDSNAVSEVREQAIVLYEGDLNETKNGEMNMIGKLFQVKETQQFGIGLAVNSSGKYVLEMKGSNDINSFDKSEIEVVMPYTFAVVWQNGQEQHFRGKAGVLKKGDMVLETNKKDFRIGRVSKIDTKVESAKAEFKGVKMITESLELEEEVIEE